MQKRHTDRYVYFQELAKSSSIHFLPYIEPWHPNEVIRCTADHSDVFVEPGGIEPPSKQVAKKVSTRLAFPLVFVTRLAKSLRIVFLSS